MDAVVAVALPCCEGLVVCYDGQDGVVCFLLGGEGEHRRCAACYGAACCGGPGVARGGVGLLDVHMGIDAAGGDVGAFGIEDGGLWGAREGDA